MVTNRKYTRLPPNKEIPVAFYTRTMSSVKRKYAQIDREALEIIAA